MIARQQKPFKEELPESAKVFPMLTDEDKKALDLLAKLIAEHIKNSSEN